MNSRRRTAIISVTLVLIYAVTLHSFSSFVSTSHGPAQAQGYPEPSAAPSGYPPPSTPTATPHRASPTPTSTGTVSVTLTSTPRTTATATPTPTIAEATRRPTPTPGATIGLPPTATQPAAAPRATTGQQPGPSPTIPPTITATAPVTSTPEAITTSAAPEANRVLADRLPAVADQRSGPGMAFTLLAGITLAGLAWWVWRRWLAPEIGVDGETTGNPPDV